MLGDLNHDKSERRKSLESDINELSVQLQAVDMRLVDLEKDAFSFKRDVLTNVGDDKTSTSTCKNNNLEKGNTSSSLSGIKSEKVLRHLQSKLLQLESTKDKLKLQQIDQRSKQSKLQSKLKQNDSSGNKLHYIDYHKYQVDNKKYKDELNIKINNELERIKISFEKSEKELVELKNVLQECKNEKQNVNKSIDLRKCHLERLQEKIQKQGDNIKTIQIKGEEQKKSMMSNADGENISYDLNVDVMDIVQQQSKLYELKGLIKTWTRKVEIAELSVQKQLH